MVNANTGIYFIKGELTFSILRVSHVGEPSKDRRKPKWGRLAMREGLAQLFATMVGLGKDRADGKYDRTL